MKILNLKIHNMASIIDATVDFENGPLGNNALFLITGPTGAGKSTILNCLCIALYNTAPAIVAYTKRGQVDSNNMRLSSPATLIRHGAKDDKAIKQAAWIEVTFIGVDHMRYTARWMAHRKNKRRDRHVVEYEITRTLQCGEHEDKISPKRDALDDKLGLNYDQFTRTVVLAQGKFSEFLSADDAIKAQLLEEITGTEEFSKIGARVYEKTSEKTRERDLLMAEIRGAELLTPEQEDELRTQARDLLTQIESLNKAKTATDTAVQWLDNQALYTASEASTKADLDKAQADLAAPQALSDKAEVKAFDDTAAARTALASLRSNESSLDKNAKATEQLLLDEMPTLLAALQWLEEDTANKKARAAEVDVLIAADKPNAEAYVNVADAKAKAKTIAQLLDAAATQRTNIETLEAKTKGLVSAQSDAQTANDNAAKALQDAKDKAEACSKAVKAYNIEEISDRLSTLNNRLSAISNARTLAEQRKGVEDTLAAEQTELDRLNGEIETAQSSLNTDKEKLPKLENTSKIAQSVLESHQTLSDNIAEIRRKMASEDRCPLCGTQHVLPLADEVMAEHLREASDKAQKAKDAVDETRKRITTTETALKEKRRSKTQRENHINQLKDNISGYDEKISVALASAGVASLDELDALETELKDKQNKAKSESTNAQTAVNNLASANNEQATAQDAADKAAEKLRAAQNAVNDNSRLINDAKNKEKDAKDSADAEFQALLALLPKGMTEDAKVEGAEQLAADFADAAKRYNDLCNEANNLSNAITEQDRVINAVSSTLTPLKDKAEAEAQEPFEDKELEQKTSALGLKLASMQGQAKQLSDAADKARRELNDCLAALPDVTTEVLDRLSARSEQISQARQRMQQLSTSLAQAEGALRQATDVLNGHAEKRPQMEEEPDVEALREKALSLASELEKLIAEKSGIDTRLRENADRAAAVADKSGELEKLNREWHLWKKLNDVVGGNGGVNFRNVAQLFVLRALLNKANHYLQGFSHRYRFVENGKQLTISVMDSEQAGAVRPVTSLSGGETFIVSLALALGLSAINAHQIHVESLFIDEGFGSLSSDCLDMVLTALQTLHGGGKRSVGIISHVEAIKDRIPTQVVVSSGGANNSTITVKG